MQEGKQYDLVWFISVTYIFDLLTHLKRLPYNGAAAAESNNDENY